jgi:hypothetical protein
MMPTTGTAAIAINFRIAFFIRFSLFYIVYALKRRTIHSNLMVVRSTMFFFDACRNNHGRVGASVGAGVGISLSRHYLCRYNYPQ